MTVCIGIGDEISFHFRKHCTIAFSGGVPVPKVRRLKGAELMFISLSVFCRCIRTSQVLAQCKARLSLAPLRYKERGAAGR